MDTLVFCVNGRRCATVDHQAIYREPEERLNGSRITASFICEVPLRATPADERELLIRLENARMVYNTCLGASLGRLKQLKEPRAFKDARAAKGMRGSEARRSDRGFSQSR